MEILKWIIFNVGFICLIIAGLVFGVGGALNVAIAIGWFIGVVGFLIAIPDVSSATIDKLTKHYRSNGIGIPIWINNVIDVGIAITFIWFGYIVLGIVFGIGTFITSDIKLKAVKNVCES